MKEYVKVYLFILIFVCLLGVSLDRGKEYAHERILWGIQNDFQKMIDQSRSIPEGAVSNIVGRYDRFILRYPKSSLIPQARLNKGNVYLFIHHYSKAREIFEQIIKDYSYNVDVVAQTQFALGKSYELEGDWEKAITYYKNIVINYPLTSIGFSVPLYIAQHYKNLGLNLKAHTAFEEAIEFYQNVAVNNLNKPIEYTSLQKLVDCHLALENWSEAFNISKKILFQYPAAPMFFDTVGTIKDICIEKMQDVNCALNTYQEFIHKNPGHPINRKLRKVIINIQNTEYLADASDE